MGDSYNEDFGCQDLVHHPIQKPSGLTPAGVLGEGRPCCRILPDAVKRAEDFQEQLFPSTWGFRIVILDRFIKVQHASLRLKQDMCKNQGHQRITDI